MTKKYAGLLIFLLLFANIAAAALPSILISKIDPQPVEPGKDLTIDVTLFNRETSETGTFSVVLDASFPIVFKSASEDLSKINLCGGCKKDFKYFLSIDAKASSGVYPIFVKAVSGSSEVKQRADIKIQGRPNLVFTTDSEGLNNITPGQQFSVVLKITNIGSGQARQVKVQPDSASFVVIGGSVKTINEINASQTSPVVFTFVASSNLEANSYLIPIRFTYFDEQGSSANTTQNLGVRVVNKGEISIQTIKIVSAAGSPVITAGQPFTVIVRLENTGPGDADFVVAEIECPFNGPKKAFIGQLKKDDDAPAVFDLTANRAETYTCNLNVQYKDDTGTHELNDRFDVAVASAPIPPVAILIALIIAGLLLFYRKRILAPFAKEK